MATKKVYKKTSNKFSPKEKISYFNGFLAGEKKAKKTCKKSYSKK